MLSSQTCREGETGAVLELCEGVPAWRVAQTELGSG